jgi:hypothetical protein
MFYFYNSEERKSKKDLFYTVFQVNILNGRDGLGDLGVH